MAQDRDPQAAPNQQPPDQVGSTHYQPGSPPPIHRLGLVTNWSMADRRSQRLLARPREERWVDQYAARIGRLS